jgi:hypothetical protein
MDGKMQRLYENEKFGLNISTIFFWMRHHSEQMRFNSRLMSFQCYKKLATWSRRQYYDTWL